MLIQVYVVKIVLIILTFVLENEPTRTGMIDGSNEILWYTKVLNSALTALSTDFDNRDEHGKTGFIVSWSHSQLTATKSDFFGLFC